MVCKHHKEFRTTLTGVQSMKMFDLKSFPAARDLQISCGLKITLNTNIDYVGIVQHPNTHRNLCKCHIYHNDNGRRDSTVSMEINKAHTATLPTNAGGQYPSGLT